MVANTVENFYYVFVGKNNSSCGNIYDAIILSKERVTYTWLLMSSFQRFLFIWFQTLVQC